MLEQRIAHFQEAKGVLEAKLAEQAAELREARRQVNWIAEKAVEGAAHARAVAGGLLSLTKAGRRKSPARSDLRAAPRTRSAKARSGALQPWSNSPRVASGM